MMTPPTRYSLPADLTQAIINTLANRPWHEVNELMARLQAECRQQEAASEAPPPPPQAPATP